MKEMWYEYWFANLPEITNERKWEIRQKTESAESIYYIEEKEKLATELTEKEKKILKESRKIKDWKAEYEAMKNSGIHMAIRGEKEYPSRFEALYQMPYALYYIGKAPETKMPSIAVVGARRCSTYGERMTLQFVKRLAENQIRIISGMALGIDGMAHRAALNAEGDTVAVLGGGVDVCYPKEHRGLYQDLIKKGGILSEYPPGTVPKAWHFPARNRLISGLADLVLVMEAKERSGSLITADMALEQGRDIYALPGPVTEPLSCGCNRLIRQGAGILLNEEDLLEELQIRGLLERKIRPDENKKNKIKLESVENLVYSKLGLYPRGLEEIQKETQLTAQVLIGTLVSLQLKGYIREKSKNYYVRVF